MQETGLDATTLEVLGRVSRERQSHPPLMVRGRDPENAESAQTRTKPLRPLRTRAIGRFR